MDGINAVVRSSGVGFFWLVEFLFLPPRAAMPIAKSAQERFDIIICHLPGWLIPPE